jgi:hypothetical protein
MKPISMRIDEKTKARMEAYPDINWSEIIRRAIKERLDIEESLRGKKFDHARALRATKTMMHLRAKTSGKWNGAEEIRKWRVFRK